MSSDPSFIERVEPTSPSWRGLGIQHLQRYQFAMHLAKGKRVLDMACGPGYGSYVMARNGAAEVLGLDISQEAIAYAQKHYKADNLTYVTGDAQAYEGARPVDMVVSFETIEHVPQPLRLIEAFERNLAPGGLLVLSAPNRLKHTQNPEAASHNPFHLNEPTYEELLGWLSGLFVVVQAHEQSPVNFDSAALLDAVHVLRGSLIINGLLKCESLLRKILGKPWLPRNAGTRLECWSEIMPLLPSRADQAEVFLLVCQKKG